MALQKLVKKVLKKPIKKIKKYFMELVHDKKSSKLVLKVSDSGGKGHVEVRGKLGYEGDGYSKKDKLHNFLDKLDAATVSKLYGSQGKVYLNPSNTRTKPSITQAKNIMKKYHSGGIVKK